jgi:uncharacterized protein involved in exopolysaccharide biosynthesis
VMTPSESEMADGLASELGMLGGLVGLTGFGTASNSNAEFIAILRSRDFARSFIEDLDLLHVLFADEWDAEAESWRSPDPEDWPDIRDAVSFFIEHVREVTEDERRGVITLSMEWTDPELSAKWANQFVLRLNNYVRRRALLEAEANVEFLQEELSKADVATLRQSIASLLEGELQKLMLARGKEEFAFRVIDRAEVPKYRERPKRRIIVVLAVLGGGLLAVFLTIIGYALKRETKAVD